MMTEHPKSWIEHEHSFGGSLGTCRTMNPNVPTVQRGRAPIGRSGRLHLGPLHGLRSPLNHRQTLCLRREYHVQNGHLQPNCQDHNCGTHHEHDC